MPGQDPASITPATAVENPNAVAPSPGDGAPPPELSGNTAHEDDAALTARAIELAKKEEKRLNDAEAAELDAFEQAIAPEEKPKKKAAKALKEDPPPRERRGDDDEDEDEAPVAAKSEDDDEDDLVDPDADPDEEPAPKKSTKESAFLEQKRKAQKERERLAAKEREISDKEKGLLTEREQILKHKEVLARLRAGDPHAALELGFSEAETRKVFEALAGVREIKKEDPKETALEKELRETKARLDAIEAVSKKAQLEEAEKPLIEKAYRIMSRPEYEAFNAQYDLTTKRGRHEALVRFKTEAKAYYDETGNGVESKGFFSAVAKRIDDKLRELDNDEDAKPASVEDSPKASGRKDGSIRTEELSGRSGRKTKPIEQMTEDELTEHAIALARVEERRLKAAARASGELDD